MSWAEFGSECMRVYASVVCECVCLSRMSSGRAEMTEGLRKFHNDRLLYLYSFKKKCMTTCRMIERIRLKGHVERIEEKRNS